MQHNLIATFAYHFEFADIIIVSKSRSVLYFDAKVHFGRDYSRAGLNSVEIIRELWFLGYDVKISLYFWAVLED